MTASLDSLHTEINRIPPDRRYGRVVAVQGLLVEVAGAEHSLSVGSRVVIDARDGRRVDCEVIGFGEGRSLVMPFTGLDGVGIGCKAYVGDTEPAAYPSSAWLGRVVNAFGEPVDGKGPLPQGSSPALLRARPPAAHERQRLAENWIWACGRSIALCLAARANAWGSLPGPAWANRF
ncbi:hypothetical protein JCM17845_29290 [Iodidimonas gelatinilytica]|uniref:Flagellum-specific ATP synthase FliI n=1 Tax=Iodidimonas gelatinilytica TaxID=1236966 RepID=A0A5A7N5L9_9PROT|nr:hypothetical protein [Iodidimonas gelatinilytica]GER02306.1 hypothetical protein JCM17845_29290 [Iodidimonas gelatinilytica]